MHRHHTIIPPSFRPSCITQTLTIDFETYFDVGYRLKTMPPILYVRDPQFMVFGCGVAIDDDPAFWVPACELPDVLAEFNPRETAIAAHNANFDGLILVEKYDYVPAQWIDTLALCRALLPVDDCGLGAVGPLLGLGEKGDDLNDVKGLRHLRPSLYRRLANYCRQDTDLANGIRQLLMPHLPADEQELMHITTRGSVEGTLRIDVPLAQQAADRLRNESEETIARSGLTAKQLRSRVTFPAHLRELGIEPPIKLNNKGKETYAFAKNDLAFQGLQADYPQHRALWEAKIAAGSTTEQTRAVNLALIGACGDETMPMPLKYAGAHTLRWSGDGKVNVQNFVRGSDVRLSLIAPDGYLIGVVDSSQIELRVNMWFCRQDDALAILAAGKDIYSITASDHFGFQVTKHSHPDERQFGKLLELALGYQMGWRKFRTQAAIGALGTPKTALTEAEAMSAVHGYRTRRHKVKETWDFLGGTILPGMATEGFRCEMGPVVFAHDAVELPNGMSLLYPNLHYNDDAGGYLYGRPGAWKKIYGGLLLENIIQCLARLVVAEQILECQRLLPIRVVSTTHDEEIFLARQNIMPAVYEYAEHFFCRPPAWAPDLPLAAEGGFDKRYSK